MIEDLKPISNALKYYLKELGYGLDEYSTDQEVLEAIKKHSYSDKTYPVMLLSSDTTGEKLFEEFYTSNDVVDETRLQALSVIQTFVGKTKDLKDMMAEANELYQNNIDKHDLVKFLEKYIEGFNHIETGKNLDQKM